MRQVKSLIPLLLAAGLILLGLLLPQYASGFQDRRLAGKISTYEIGAVELGSVNRLEGSLRLITDERTLVELSRGARLDAKGAYEAALEALLFIADYGIDHLPPSDAIEHAETPYLAVSADGSATAVFWQCWLGNGSSKGLWLMIDDSSGKMLSFQAWDNSELALKNAPSFDISAKSMATMAAAYYGLTPVSVQPGGSLNKIYGASFYSLVMENENGETLPFNLTIAEEYVVFNTLMTT